MTGPAVTILMPAYNAERFIADSIRSALGQTYGDFELLVIDDGSTDATHEVVGSFSDPRVRLHRRLENKGLVFTLNEGLEIARASLVARQDADDLCHPRRLAIQCRYMSSHRGMDAVASSALLIDERGCRRGRLRIPGSSSQLNWDLCFRNPIPHSSVMLRKEQVLKKFGGYPESPSSEDYALWSKIAGTGRFGLIEDTLISYRIHAASIMKSSGKGEAEISTIRRENMERVIGKIGTQEDLELLQMAWRSPGMVSWKPYCEVFERLAASHERIHGSLGKIPGIEYQTLCQLREDSPALLFQALLSEHPQRLLSIPWMRMMASLILSLGR
jgi:glycosyltransferase involved in cell wall biosynthesis